MKYAEFARECREGRVEIYSQKIWRNIKRLLDRTYPIARRALGEEWEPLCRDFLENQPIASPYFWRMPSFLVEYVEKVGPAKLYDLLLFEWREVEVMNSPDEPIPPIKKEGDLLRDPLVFNPHFSIDPFRYPVFRVPYHELKEEPTYLLTFRTPVKLNICYIELDPIYVVLCSDLSSTREKWMEPFLNELMSQGALLGFLEET